MLLAQLPCHKHLLKIIPIYWAFFGYCYPYHIQSMLYFLDASRPGDEGPSQFPWFIWNVRSRGIYNDSEMHIGLKIRGRHSANNGDNYRNKERGRGWQPCRLGINWTGEAAEGQVSVSQPPAAVRSTAISASWLKVRLGKIGRKEKGGSEREERGLGKGIY